MGYPAARNGAYFKAWQTSRKNLFLQGEPGISFMPGSHAASRKKPASIEAGFDMLH